MKPFRPSIPKLPRGARIQWLAVYWREIFEHWLEAGQTLPEFCAEVGYDMSVAYGNFTRRFYREFQLRQMKLGVKTGRAAKAA